MKSRVISNQKSNEITLAILIKANEENIKSFYASHIEISDALLPYHMEGMKVLQTAHQSLTGYGYLKEYDTSVDARFSYREVVEKIISYKWRFEDNVVDMFYDQAEYYHYGKHPNPKFVYGAPSTELSHDTDNELYPLYERWVKEFEGVAESLFNMRVLSPIGGGYLHCTPELLIELTPLLEKWSELRERMAETYKANDALAEDIKRNIARARTTKNICRDWPEIAGFVARLYGEEEAAQEMEVPLGNIIARHHPNLLGAPA